MHRSNEFSIEVWPGVIRLHQNYEAEDWSTIELAAEQVADLCKRMIALAEEAKELGNLFQAIERSGVKTPWPHG